MNNTTSKRNIDKLFLLSVISLVIVGFFIFTSASLGLLAKGKENFGNVAFNQTFFGLFGGTIALLVLSKINYRVWRKYALYIFIFSILLTVLVFIPQIGFEHSGARRWISIGNFTLQPVEFLKLGFVIYLAAWLSGVKDKVKEIKFGIIPFLVLVSIIAVILVNQPDMGTFVVIFTAGFAMFISAGSRWRDIFLIIIIAGIGFSLIAYNKPYMKERIYSFLDPSKDALTSSYQLQQSLIAIGSGGFSGRGFGQSIQKFSFLPEPVGDSIFAVWAEEFGFIGSIFLIFLFLFFAFQGLKIARKSKDLFGGLLTIGIVILIVFQSFLNMAAMLGVVPLSGMPLLFISHGGTALFFALAGVGIILNVSKYQSR